MSPTAHGRRRAWAGAPWVLVLGLAASAPGAAAPGTTDAWRPAPSVHDGSGGLQLVHPFTGGQGSTYLGGVLTTAERFDAPLGLRRLSAVHLGGGWAPVDWLRLEADVPVVAAQVDADQVSGGLGATQLSATVPLLSATPGGLGVGLHPFVIAPAPGAVSGGPVSGGAALLVGGGGGGLGWRVNLGGRSGPDGGQVDLGAGGNWRVHSGVGLGAEVVSNRPVGPRTTADAPAAPVEATVYALLGADRRVATTIGCTAGLVPDTGSPAYRVQVAWSWRKTGAPGDPDADGIWGVADLCPHAAEDPDDHLDTDGCPDPDDDDDGVPDTLDRCPTEAEDPDDHLDADGCPDTDNDFDGVLDGADACRNEPGPPAAQGCPDRDGDTVGDPTDECSARPGATDAFGCPDGDADRVPDYRDLCPTEPVSRKVDPVRSSGCPSRAYLGAGRIELLDRVNFDVGRATIRPESAALLGDVARVLRENPNILQVEIGGHTDTVGGDLANLRLSKARATAVREALIAQGIAADRLVARGFGEGRPIDTNATEAGRYQNRRVEFLIVRTATPDASP